MLPEKGMHHADVLSRVKRLKTAKDTNSAMKLTVGKAMLSLISGHIVAFMALIWTLFCAIKGLTR